MNPTGHNWDYALDEATTPAQTEALHNAVLNAAMTLIDSAVTETCGVLSGARDIVDMHRGWGTMRRLPRWRRGSYDAGFARSWTVVAAQVFTDLLCGDFEVHTVVEYCLLQALLDQIQSSTSDLPDDYMPPEWRLNLECVMSPLWGPDWEQLLETLPPAQWFFRQDDEDELPEDDDEDDEDEEGQRPTG